MNNETTEKRYLCLQSGNGIEKGTIYPESYITGCLDMTVAASNSLWPECWELVTVPESAPFSLSQEAYDGLVKLFEKAEFFHPIELVHQWAQQFKVELPKT